MDEYSDIIAAIKATPAVPPPAGFTDRVMGRVHAFEPSAGSKIRQAVLRRCSTPLHLKALFAMPTNAAECSFCFIMAGFFYLIMGVVLLVGLRAIGGEVYGGWFTCQPLASFVIAFGLAALGMVLRKGSIGAIRTVRFGILTYVGFVIIGGVGTHLEFGIPLHFMTLICLVAGGLVMAAFLSIIVRRCHAMLVGA